MKTFKIIGLAFCLIGTSALGINSMKKSDNANTHPKKITVTVKLHFSLFDIERKPLTGKLKEYQEGYFKKHNVKYVPPSTLPKPLIDGKPVELKKFYQDVISKLDFDGNTKSMPDTCDIIFYLDTKGNVKPAYAMDKRYVPFYDEILKHTSEITNWTPAYFGSTPGEVAGKIEIVISEGALR